MYFIIMIVLINIFFGRNRRYIGDKVMLVEYELIVFIDK